MLTTKLLNYLILQKLPRKFYYKFYYNKSKYILYMHVYETCFF